MKQKSKKKKLFEHISLHFHSIKWTVKWWKQKVGRWQYTCKKKERIKRKNWNKNRNFKWLLSYINTLPQKWYKMFVLFCIYREVLCKCNIRRGHIVWSNSNSDKKLNNQSIVLVINGKVLRLIHFNRNLNQICENPFSPVNFWQHAPPSRWLSENSHNFFLARSINNVRKNVLF